MLSYTALLVHFTWLSHFHKDTTNSNSIHTFTQSQQRYTHVSIFFSLKKMFKYCWIYYVTSTSSSSPFHFQPKPNPIIPESFLEDFSFLWEAIFMPPTDQTRAKSKQTEHINFMTISLTNIYLCRVLLGSIKHGVKPQNSLFHFSRRKKLGVM